MSRIGYNGAKVTAVRKLTTLLPAARKGASSEIYARSLRNLPKGSMLVVATFPIIDWNDCLLRHFQNVSKGSHRHMYAAITFRRPIFGLRGVSVPLACFRTPGATGEAVSPGRISWRIRTNSITYGAQHGTALALSSICQPETKSPPIGHLLWHEVVRTFR